MIVFIFLFPVFLSLYSLEAAVFLWSNKKLEISALQPFTNEQLFNLSEELGNPDLYYFRSSSRISPDIRTVIGGYYSAYVPNGDINVEKSIDLLGNDVLDAETVKETLSHLNKSSNILSIIFIPRKQYKREIEFVTTEMSEEMKISSQNMPVIYIGKNQKNEYALLYSSKPLLLRINETEMHLGNTNITTYDSRLHVTIKPLEGKNKIILRFSFSWLNGYWSLSSVKVTDIEKNMTDYNLTTAEDIMAPAHFSYHCNGYTIFSDKSGGTELYIYDLQVQGDSMNGKFGDVNDCVTFTTAPIWSGLFVTTLLGIGLIIALTAIMDIKTMDKFDNYKTKNLNITVSE